MPPWWEGVKGSGNTLRGQVPARQEAIQTRLTGDAGPPLKPLKVKIKILTIIVKFQ